MTIFPEYINTFIIKFNLLLALCVTCGVERRIKKKSKETFTQTASNSEAFWAFPKHNPAKIEQKSEYKNDLTFVAENETDDEKQNR